MINIFLKWAKLLRHHFPNQKNMSPGWWFQIFFHFHPNLGKIPILTHIFQRGWSHQLVFVEFCWCHSQAKSPSAPQANRANSNEATRFQTLSGAVGFRSPGFLPILRDAYRFPNVWKTGAKAVAFEWASHWEMNIQDTVSLQPRDRYIDMYRNIYIYTYIINSPFFDSGFYFLLWTLDACCCLHSHICHLC